MSRSLGSELPPDVFDRLSGRRLDAVQSNVIQAFTVDSLGWPHPALLSYFEVVALDPRRIRLATYRTSTTSENMRRRRLLTLVLIDVRNAHYVKGQTSELAPIMRTTPWNAGFECRVSEVLVDEVDERYEPGAYLSSGVTYYSPERAKGLEQARLLLDELRSCAPAS